MRNYFQDTICAISTPSGIGGISVIRISGPRALDTAARLFAPKNTDAKLSDRPQMLRYGKLIDPDAGVTIDEALVAYMRGPNSYTGEDVVEINCHGGPVVMEQVLGSLYKLGCRAAEPGEFTKRAFMNGRIDLIQAESVLDIIQAKSGLSLAVANRQLEGGLSATLSGIKTRILDVWSDLEAAVDFSDEDIETTTYSELRKRVEAAIYEVGKLLGSYETGRIYYDGLRAVIIGRPNAGKSSLLNWLLKEERAIVTDVPGTTRDIIEDHMLVRGVPVKIHDTAGIIETTDKVEKIGIQRALVKAEESDVVICVLDVTTALKNTYPSELSALLNSKKVLYVLNKSDEKPLFSESDLANFIRKQHEQGSVNKGAVKYQMCSTSASKGQGLDLLEAAFLGLVPEAAKSEITDVIITKARHKISLTALSSELETLNQGLKDNEPEELLSVHAKECLERLGEITGETIKADVLDTVFAKFCIGK